MMVTSDDNVYILTECGLDPSLTSTQAEIDAQVKEAVAGETCSTSSKDMNINSIYPILEHEFQKANPTIVFTQNLCAVCAPSVQDVENLLLLHNNNNNDGNGNNDNKVQILSLDPHTLEDVAQTFVNIATLCNVPGRGQIMKDAFLTKLNLVQKAVDDHTISTNSSSVSSSSVSSSNSNSTKKKRVLLLEWLDPPYDAGHWIPNMIENAGCIPIKIKIETNTKKHIFITLIDSIVL
jgi:iron complex transport system substrate-binding protein